MSRDDLFHRILASLHEATLDDAHWPAAADLIDEACGSMGNMLVFGEGCSQKDTRIHFARFWLEGERRKDLERDYFNFYYPLDTRVERLKQRPEGKVFHVEDLYTSEEKKTSVVYNEALPRAKSQKSINVRMAEPFGASIYWAIANPVGSAAWRPGQLDRVKRLMPHVQRFVRLRQALFDADALRASLSQLLEIARCGVAMLDGAGRIVETNDLALHILREGDGLFTQRGHLRARMREDDASLQVLLEGALPKLGVQSMSGSATIRRLTVSSTLVLHAIPIGARQDDFLGARVAALLLIADPGSEAAIDSFVVAAALGLTQAEGRVAGLLASGNSIREVAKAISREESTIRWHLKHIFRKQGISRQAELIRRVHSIAGFRRSKH